MSRQMIDGILMEVPDTGLPNLNTSLNTSKSAIIQKTGTKKAYNYPSPSITLNSRGQIGMSMTPKPQEDEELKSLQKQKLRKELESKDNQGILKLVSAEDAATLKVLPKLPAMIKRTKELISNLDPSYLASVTRNIRGSNKFTMTPEVQKIKSAYGLVTSNLLKMYQGSRPSDFDYEIWNQISGGGVLTPENMLAALNEVERTFDTSKEDFIYSTAKGYEIPEQKVRDFLNFPSTKTTANIKSGIKGTAPTKPGVKTNADPLGVL
jgi:hypothetical protein